MNQLVSLAVFSLCCTLALTGPVKQNRSYSALEQYENRTSYILVENEDGTYRIENLKTSTVQATASENDVTYYLFNKRNKDHGVAVKNPTNLPTTAFDKSKEVVIAIHGWRNDYTSKVNSLIKSAVLNKFDLNFIVVDWSPISKKNYITAKNAVPKIGKYVGNFIQSLVSTYKISLSKISLVGHSLGAHVAGVAGSALNGKIDHIVGLDPASPLISTSNKAFCLDTSDAQFVHVIHTNGGVLGLTKSIGHADYFPNGGKRQPGCGVDAAGTCAHNRAYEYYAASIDHQFRSQKCSSYKDFTKGRCSGSYALMGGYHIHKGASGNFYLDTSKSYPYTLG